MRIHIPDDAMKNTVGYMVGNYATGLTQSAYQFSRATYEHSRLTLREFEAARLRTAHINGCLMCQAWRSGSDGQTYLSALGGNVAGTVLERGPAPDEHFYDAISEWRTSSIFSERERAAIEFAEKLGTDPQGLATDDAFWGRFKTLFSDDEIVDLGHCIACWMGLGRVVHALGLDTVCYSGADFAPAANLAPA